MQKPVTRVKYLWRKASQFAYAIDKFVRLSNNLQVYGVPKKNYWKNSRAHLKTRHSGAYDCVLTYKSRLRYGWAWVMAVLLFSTAVYVPISIAFHWVIDDAVVDFFFLLDIGMNFFCSYYNLEGIQELNLAKILSNYVTRWFVIDILSVFPFGLFIQVPGLAFSKLLRLCRVPRQLLVLKKKHQRLFSSLQVLKFAVTQLLIVHIVACLWYYFSINRIDSWVYRYGYLDSTPVTLYITSVYWVFVTLTTVGYGDIVPFTAIERLFTCFLMAFGVALYSFAISNLSSLFRHQDSIETEKRKKLAVLNVTAKSTGMPHELKAKLKGHLCVIAKNTRKFALGKLDIMGELPATLRTDLALHIYKNLVSKIHFFQDKDPEFILFIVSKLSMIRVEVGEVLFNQGEHPEAVYFLLKGRVRLQKPHSLPFRSINAGSYFGEEDILDGNYRSYTAVVASPTAKLLVLTRRWWLKVLEEFPRIADEIVQIARIKVLKYGSNCQRVSYTLKSWNDWHRFPCYKRNRRNAKEKNRQRWKASSQPTSASTVQNLKDPVNASGIMDFIQKSPLLKFTHELTPSPTQKLTPFQGHLFDVRRFIDELKVPLGLDRTSPNNIQLAPVQFIRQVLIEHSRRITVNVQLMRQSLNTMQTTHKLLQAQTEQVFKHFPH